MSTYLWKYYFDHDVESFRKFLANVTYGAPVNAKKITGNLNVSASGSPGSGTSPNSSNKHRATSGEGQSEQIAKGKKQRPSTTVNLTRADLNAKDAHGVTLLHHLASSDAHDATPFAIALLEAPLIDVYLQDIESGWSALHRALYSGNVTIAKALINREIRDPGFSSSVGGLIKVKDREGNSPFDVFGASIPNRVIHQGTNIHHSQIRNEEEENDEDALQGHAGDRGYDGDITRVAKARTCVDGDEFFMFGSNKNFTLGLGNEDDRQYPERISLDRPFHLLRRFDVERQSKTVRQPGRAQSPDGQDFDNAPFRSASSIPAVVKYKPAIIQDVQLSKLHSAVLTTDPEANLYICGFGPGGRLGTGDEATRFNFVCIHGGGLSGKKVIAVSLGQNHTVAVSSEGQVFTWGTNTFGQLGYVLPVSNVKEHEPIQMLPRQIYGSLKRELIIGSAASSIHSVVFTPTSLYAFGKNDGQLGLVDSDARSLEVQNTPRKIAAALFSSTICMASAVDRATICLLDNHDVWVFANYGYTKITFPVEGFSNYFLRNSLSATKYDDAPNHISKITSGGDTICAMSRSGDVFTVQVDRRTDSVPATASTTNPTKIRGALSQSQRVWSPRKGHMAVRDVDVGQDGSIIICTQSGSVWRRVKRAKIKHTNASALIGYKPKDYKFSRIPSLTRIVAVRSNMFGAFAAIRRDCDVLKVQIDIEASTIWQDIFPLLPFHGFYAKGNDSDSENPAPRFWVPAAPANKPKEIIKAVLASSNLELDIATLIEEQDLATKPAYDLRIGSTVSEIRLPMHEFVLTGRSPILRKALAEFHQTYFYSIADILTIEYNKDGRPTVIFQGMDFLTIFNLAFFLYTDLLVDVWHHIRHTPGQASRYRQVRTELMKVAHHIELRTLEQAARNMGEPAKSLTRDFKSALAEKSYLDSGDVEIKLNGSNIKAHSALLCQRCPFFEALFHGRAAGRWLEARRELRQDFITVDLKHVDPAIFALVLQHIYCDASEELFDDIVTADFEEFLDLILEVLSLANELMLDRLAQVCQKVLGHFVNTRNVCSVLSAVAPCSVSQFKDVALEYICLNLEGMLENHLLNGLDEDLMVELDAVVRQNQLACLPFVKSGRAEAELKKRHPELVEIRERSKRAKIDSLALQSRLEARFPSSSKIRISLDEDRAHSLSPGTDSQQTPKERTSSSNHPALRMQRSANDLIFEMEDGDEEPIAKARTGGYDHVRAFEDLEKQWQVDDAQVPSYSTPKDDIWYDAKGKALPQVVEEAPIIQSNVSNSSEPNVERSSGFGGPWKSGSLSTAKLSMESIMAQASLKRESNVSFGIPSHTEFARASIVGSGQKPSQKERKRQQHVQAKPSEPLQNVLPAQEFQSQSSQDTKPASPWRTAPAGQKVALKNIFSAGDGLKSTAIRNESRETLSPSLTLRQTIPGSTLKQSTEHQSSSPSKVLGEGGSPTVSQSPSVRTSFPRPVPSEIGESSRSSSTAVPNQSMCYQPSPIEPSLQLSMADILVQQQMEKDIMRDVAAKRSLQEIQQEQEFQQWWDQESRKAMQEEAAASSPSPSLPGGRGSRRRGKARGGARRQGRGGGQQSFPNVA